MYTSKRVFQMFAITTCIVCLVFLQSRTYKNRTERPLLVTTAKISAGGSYQAQTTANSLALSAPIILKPGVLKPGGAAYSRVIVLPCMKEDEVAWIKKELPNVEIAVYNANDSAAPLHPPKNKGHEVMVYLTYIIENYAQLPDIAIFMHAHRWTHHNNELLDYDAVQMISKLSSNHVIREGYFNMRCQWEPGCPEWLDPTNLNADLGKQEEVVLSRCWKELFPLDPLPRFLAQACCAQFALSKERILSIPLSRFMFYRNWILMTPLSDYISGRIWEYSWQYIFTGRHTNCPAEHICYCDGFGICFGGETQYRAFLQLQNQIKTLQAESDFLEAQEKDGDKAGQQGTMNYSANIPFPVRHSQLEDRIQATKKELESRRMDALERGYNARQRAEECGRSWEQGDDFEDLSLGLR